MWAAWVPHDGQEGACSKGRAGHVTQPPTLATCTVTQAPRDGPGPSSHGESTFRKSFVQGNEQWGARGPLRPVALRLVGSPLQVACNPAARDRGLQFPTKDTSRCGAGTVLRPHGNLSSKQVHAIDVMKWWWGQEKRRQAAGGCG